jgi:hypothetical protein
MKIWQRLLITLAVMPLASGIASMLWHMIFQPAMPAYLSGVIGGLAALGAWELLRPAPKR